MSDIEAARTVRAPAPIEIEKKDLSVEHNEELGYSKSEDALTRDGAIAAEQAEAAMTFTEAFRDYRSAVLWSLGISLCIIMEGYDTALPVSSLVMRYQAHALTGRATLTVSRPFASGSASM
jgi:hypothetical protein